MRLFSEEDFASWLDQLGERLVAAPDWRALLVYRGVSAWEAGYWLFHHGFLDALRATAAGTETPTWDLHSRFRPARLRMLWRSVASGEMGLREVPISIASRLLYRVRMSLPSQKWPGANGFPRALILEAFPNNLTTLVPVARVLDRDLNWDVLFAGWGPKVEGPVREAGLKCAGIEALFRRRLIRLETQHYRDVELALARLELQEPVALLQELSGIPLAVNPRGLLHRVCVLVRTFTDVYNEMRDRWKPDVIVLLTNTRLRAAPSLTLLH